MGTPAKRELGPSPATAHGEGGARLAAIRLAVLLAASTALHWLAASRVPGLWILPDEAVYATRALDFWRHGSLNLFHGEGSGYGPLYPIVAGFPLGIGSIAEGLRSLKLLQCLIVSLAAVPVYLYARALMPRRYGFLAAALTLCSPLLLYSGLVMTEVLFYPVAAVALLTIARAVETAQRRDQLLALLAILVAVLTRPQAVVFVGVFVAAILADACGRRDWGRLRSFWPVGAVCAVGILLLAARPASVGAYAVALRGSYPIGNGLKLSGEHLSYETLATGLAPMAALVLFTVRVLRGREPSPRLRALVAVAASAVVLLVVQVGLFASRYSPHLLGRDLAALPPLLFLVFAAWLAREDTLRRWVERGVAGFAVAVLVLAAPWNSLVSPYALPDSPGLQPYARLHWHTPEDKVSVVVIVVVLAFVFVPRSASPLLAATVVALLVAASVFAAAGIADAARQAQSVLGADPSWIDAAVDGHVTYVFDDQQFWNVPWQERFWNRRIDRIVSLQPNVVPGPLDQTRVRVPASGLLPITDRYVVGSSVDTFAGTPVAQLPEPSLDINGLTLWKLDGPARLLTHESGFEPNGDLYAPGTVRAYDCTGGQLELTLLPKATSVVRVLFDGHQVLSQSLVGKPSWYGVVPVPAHHGQTCTFTIVPQGLLGTTQVQFVPG